jgi:gamma-glutamyltranspeptidase
MSARAPPQPRFAARRSPVLGRHGMVCCSQPLAAEAGLSILKVGGNAADAAVAVAAALAVTEPCSTGLGGDAFAIHYDAASGRVEGLNASGRAPAALTVERARADFGLPPLPMEAAPPSAGPPPPAVWAQPLHAHAVTVPGAAAGWCDTLARWGSGRLTLADVLAPAVRLAREGFPVSPLTAHAWARGVPVLLHHAPHASAAHELLLPQARPAEGEGDSGGDGGGSSAFRAPRAGEVFTNPSLADTLEELAAGGKEAFYGKDSRIARAIVAAVRAAGGLLAPTDLSSHVSTFPDPVSVVYRGVRVWELPPNGQGITALMALNILKQLQVGAAAAEDEGEAAADLSPSSAAAAGFLSAKPLSSTASAGATPERQAVPTLSDVATAAAAHGEGIKSRANACPPPLGYCGVPVPPAAADARSLLSVLGPHGCAAALHLQIEALRLAFADSRWYVADPAVVHVPVAALLSEPYARTRAALVRPYAAAADVARGSPAGSDTVSFQVVDGRGNAVSFVNSNFAGFGTGIVPAGCGFSLQNRGANFALGPRGAPNLLAPSKRPYHTIIPGLATVDGDRGGDGDGGLFASFSCMGGFMQPQGHLQLLVAMLNYGGGSDGGGRGGLDPQTAVDLPRFCIGESHGSAAGAVLFEDGIEEGVVEELRARGHAIGAVGVAGFDRSAFGRAQIIYRDRHTGVLWGGSDGRGDGCAMGY